MYTFAAQIKLADPLFPFGDEYVAHTIYPRKAKGQAQLQFVVESPVDLERICELLGFLQDHSELELM